MTALDECTAEMTVTVPAAELTTGLIAVLPHVDQTNRQGRSELACVQLTVGTGAADAGRHRPLQPGCLHHRH